MSHMYNNTVEGGSELLVGRPRCEATAISKGLLIYVLYSGVLIHDTSRLYKSMIHSTHVHIGTLS